VNLPSRLRRGILVAALASAVAGGAAGTTHAGHNPATAPLTVSAATARAATHAPAPDGAPLAAAVTAPSAPRSPTATPRNTIVKLTWLAPSSNGGAAVNTYRVQRATSAKGPWKTIAKPTVRRYRAGGLSNGKGYYFRIAAHNRAGWSPASKVVKAVPRTVPTAPRSPVATPGNGTVKVTWQAPSSNGGAAINKYLVQRAIGAGAWKNVAYPTTRSYTAIGLTNGTRYYFRVRAHNAAGWSPYSAVVNAVPWTVPTAPQSPAATPYTASVGLKWLAPSSTGGAKIDQYRVQRYTSASGVWTPIATPTALGYTAGGLTNGINYSFRIAAQNAAGWGPYSAVVNAVPYTFATAPQSPHASFGDAAVTLSWLAPSSNGGAAIDKYIIYGATSAAGPFKYIGTTGDAALGYWATELTNGTRYYFMIAAQNAAGLGTWSTVVDAMPVGKPSMPPCGAAQWLDLSPKLRIQWQTPSSDGGLPIESYRIEINSPNGWYYIWGPNVHQFDVDLPYGTYQIKVRAANAIHGGEWCTAEVTMHP
jgi:Fibronectin type III domain